MSKAPVRAYSRYSLDAITLLGNLIRATRKAHKMTMQEVTNRVGIFRDLSQCIEKGSSKCELEATFDKVAQVRTQKSKSC